VWVVDEAPDLAFRPLAVDEMNGNVLGRYELSPTDRFFLYVGGVNPHKKLSVLIEALAVLRGQPAYQDLRLVIVGETRIETFTPGLADLKTLITKLHLTDAVCFTGFLPDADIVYLFNAAQALVLPSLSEGFGLPAIEGAACGTPVVATCNSPLPQLLAGGGLFFDPTRPDQLITTLQHILSDETKRRHMGQVALERARRLTWQHSADQMQALLAEVAQARR